MLSASDQVAVIVAVSRPLARERKVETATDSDGLQTTLNWIVTNDLPYLFAFFFPLANGFSVQSGTQVHLYFAILATRRSAGN